jgi:hypothetical protein
MLVHENINFDFSSKNSFKTKGNLTKHMKSKAHFKKCSEMGINPDTLMIEYERNEFLEDEKRRENNLNGRGNESRPDSEDDDNESDDDDDDSSEGKIIDNVFLSDFFSTIFFYFIQTLTSLKVECQNMKLLNFYFHSPIKQRQQILSHSR